jgi:hypothetical protein
MTSSIKKLDKEFICFLYRKKHMNIVRLSYDYRIINVSYDRKKIYVKKYMIQKSDQFRTIKLRFIY